MKKTSINTTRLESIPYQNLFNRRIKIENWADRFIWLAGLLALIFVFIPYNTIFDIVSCAVTLIGIGLSWAASIFFGPTAEFERIGGFVDNGYETCILTMEMDYKYYNNGVAEKGYKRIAANCFENCFFTDNVSSAMTPRIVIVNLLCIFLFIILTFINFKADLISALFQFLASSVLLEKLIRHLYFRHCIQELLEKFKVIHSLPDHDSEQFSAYTIYLIIKYEKTLSHYNSSLDSDIFDKLNAKLSEEWEEMKIRYKIIP